MANKTSKLNLNQLALAIQIQENKKLEDFCWTNNELIHQQIETILNYPQERILYLRGDNGNGKSHLLQACCQAFQQQHTAVYLPLKLLKEWGTESLEGMEAQSLLCIDDIDAIAGDSDWEESLFHLYNRVRDEEESLMIISGKLPPAALPIELPDLKSRLGWGLVMQIKELSDEDKIITLQSHAEKRGFQFPSKVGHYLISRCSRNMHDLIRLLDHLDEVSLAAQRKITIPFVKTALGL